MQEGVKHLRATISLALAVPIQMHDKKNRRVDPGIESDPFGEGAPVPVRKAVDLLGGRFRFESNSKELLALVDAAYAGLPSHLFSSAPKTVRVKIMLTP